MSADTTKEPTLVYRILWTPVFDLLRGRITGPRVPMPAQPAPAPIALPHEARALVDRVVRRTRLWRFDPRVR